MMCFDNLFVRSLSHDNKTIFNIYKVSLCEAIPEKFQCSLCHQLMQNPLQTCRGELACERCYKEALQDTVTCPIDGQPIDANQYYNDKFINTQIQMLKCFCVNKVFGCEWEGVISDLKVHSHRCNYKTVKCCLCEEKVCQTMMSGHLRDCPRLSLDVKCIYAGCSFKPVNVDDLENHIKNDVINHALLSSAAVRNMQVEFNMQFDAQKKKANDDQEKLEGQMKDMVDQISLFMLKAKKTIEDSERKMVSLQQRIDVLENDSPSSSSGNSNNESQLVEVSENIHKIQRTISDLNLRQQLSENTSYEGKLIWKIGNVSTRMVNAKKGNIVALHSAPVFTSKYGYKFCGRLFLNGDGVGKGTHVSLFFVLMKSEYDNLLSWPFNKRITMRLIHPSNPQKDIVESFDTAPSSTSYTKPTRDMNIASGCPMFIKQEDLHSGGFIQDDDMFIELSVS